MNKRKFNFMLFVWIDQRKKKQLEIPQNVEYAFNDKLNHIWALETMEKPSAL